MPAQPPNYTQRADVLNAAQLTIESGPPLGSRPTTPSGQISAPANLVLPPTSHKRLLSPVLLWTGLAALILGTIAVSILVLTRSSTPSRHVSDSEIINSIRSKFAADPGLSKYTLDVKSVNGVVTLTGLVNSDSDRKIVVRVAAQQDGVKQVNTYGLNLNNSSTVGQGSSASSTGSQSPNSRSGGIASPSGTAVAPYIFNGAYAIYAIHYGALSIPLKISIDEVDPARRTYKGTAAFGDILAHLTSSQTVDFNQGEFALLPPKGLIALLRGTTTPDLKLPTDFHRTGAVIFHEVGVSAPAGSFLTEEVVNGQDFAWYEIHSGLMVKIEGPSVAADIASSVPDVPRPSSASIELVTTNVFR